MVWLIIASAILFIILVWIGKRPNYYNNVTWNELTRFFEAFISQGVNGCIIFIRHVDSKKFLQFAKFVSDESKTIINFGFPDVPWSRCYFKPIILALESEKIDYQIQGTGDDPEFVTRFIDINLELNKEQLIKTVEQCIRITEIAFKAMGIKNSDKFRIHFEGRLYPDTESSRPILEKLKHHKKMWISRFAEEYLEILNSESKEKGEDTRKRHK